MQTESEREGKGLIQETRARIKTLENTQGKARQDYSPIQMVIVSQGEVSDFHHIEGVVGDLIAVRIQDVGVFLSPPP